MKDKKYIKPEADIIEFSDADIIITSGEGWDWGLGGVDDDDID